ncbi:MAG TPA: right-handed parallel beta-helix repeat-containing protein [Candidatus Acidoferrales bacterium]|nr:right-handed parallel beta-helix repeat-containing protein [Candidatus Acidoferrales bacterium]
MKIMKTAAMRLLILAALFWPINFLAEAATLKLTCSAKDTIANALKKLKPGDTLLVSGTCNENVEIPFEAARITLDGHGKATIKGPDSSVPTVTVRGRGITIKGFVITGGREGIQVPGGGEALIDGNTIERVGRFGIQVNRGSSGVIVNNTIRNSTGQGITIGGSSYALIGIRSGLDKTASPNTVENNGGNGINVGRSASARIVGNTIRNNKGSGVNVARASQADVSHNTIDGNAQDGISVTQNSSLSLGVGTGTGIFDQPNTTGSPNGGVGVRCTRNSSVDGRLGNLNGSKGAREFEASCSDSTAPGT